MILSQHNKDNPLILDKYPGFEYFQLNKSLPPTIEQQHEQDYIKHTIINQDKWGGIINMKTGRGKTHIMFWLIEYFKVPTLILCHNIKQAHDTYEKLQAFSNINTESDLSLCTSKTKETDTKFITITTHTGFVRHFKEKYQNKFDQIIYDECDYNLSFPVRQEFDGCMSSSIIMSNASIVWGLTGTPYQSTVGTEALTRLIGPIISKPDQLNNGYNTIPHIYQVHYYGDYNYTWTTWNELRTQMVDDKNRRDMQVDLILNKLGKFNLLLLEFVRESEIFYEELQLKLKTHKLIIMNGQLGVKRLREQQEILAEARKRGEPYLLVGVIDMLGRGIDIPEIDSVFLFAPVKFEGTVAQAVGRALRAQENKPEVKVYDWLDLPLLKKQYEQREKMYITEYTENVLIDKIYTHVLN